MKKFSGNPFMFKVNCLNGEFLNVGTGAGQLLGNAVHKAMQVFFGGDPDVVTPAHPGEAAKLALETGMKMISDVPSSMVDWSKNIYGKEKLVELFNESFTGILKEEYGSFPQERIVLVEKMLKHAVEFEGRTFPVPLKGKPDLVWRDEKGRIVIDDYKTSSKHDDQEKIDGGKLIQAVVYFFLVWAETGERPYACRFMQYKYVKNQDKTKPQLNRYVMKYSDLVLGFELFYRLYDDMTQALLGKQVYVPNFDAIFDNEVAIVSYVYRLDEEKTRDKLMREHKVTNLTDLLQKQIQKTGKMKKYLEAVSGKFVSGKTLNYKEMKTEDKIKMKMAEHGIALDFHSKSSGGSVTLYRYEPSIGLKMARVEKYAKDVEQVVERQNVRVLAPVPNTGFVGFEVPNENRTFEPLPEAAGSFDFHAGKTVSGESVTFDLRAAPHVLVAGAAGSGKSVFLSNLIRQASEKKRCEIFLFDPKIVEMKHFAKAPNVVKYESDPVAIQKSLHGLVGEMNARYEKLSTIGARDVSETDEIPYKLVFIDEFGDLAKTADKEIQEWKLCRGHLELDFDTNGHLSEILNTNRKLRVKEQELHDSVRFCKECEKNVWRAASESVLMLSQKGRAAGIHLVIATQRPSVDVISGTIKANFPAKFAFRMAREADSRVLLDEAGAEKLLGKGDCLFQSENGMERLQAYSHSK